MPTPEGSNHHSHENPTFIHDPEEVKYSAVSSAVAPCSPSLRSALRAKPRREVNPHLPRRTVFFPNDLPLSFPVVFFVLLGDELLRT